MNITITTIIDSCMDTVDSGSGVDIIAENGKPSLRTIMTEL